MDYPLLGVHYHIMDCCRPIRLQDFNGERYNGVQVLWGRGTAVQLTVSPPAGGIE